METVVLYTSHYGATKQYATALAAAALHFTKLRLLRPVPSALMQPSFS